LHLSGSQLFNHPSRLSVSACQPCSSSTKAVCFSVGVRRLCGHPCGSIDFVGVEVEPAKLWVKATTEPSGIIPNQSACCYCCIAYRHADGGKQSHAALSQGHNVLKHGCENTSAGERWPLREEEATAVCAVHISKFQHYRLKITTVLFLFIFRVGSRYIPLH